MSNWIFMAYLSLGVLTLGWTGFVMVNALTTLFSALFKKSGGDQESKRF
jgi:hypothetical protein